MGPYNGCFAALTALLVADRGELDFDAPVARYWPQFAANGKDDITVAQVMSHSAGLSGWREPLQPEGERATASLAAQEPFWKPGTASGYHVVTQGFLIGEVVRRITGRSLSETTCRRALEVRIEGDDLILGMPVRFGLGFAVGGDFVPGPNTLCWGGAGGSPAVIDMDRRATYAYAMNRMGGGRTGDLRAFGPISAAWDALAGAGGPATG